MGKRTEERETRHAGKSCTVVTARHYGADVVYPVATMPGTILRAVHSIKSGDQIGWIVAMFDLETMGDVESYANIEDVRY